MSERDELRGTLSNTICNASFYPERAEPYLLGGDMSTVLDKTADALLEAGYRKRRIIATVEDVEALFALDASVVLMDEDGLIVQSLAGGWSSPVFSDFLTSEKLYRLFGPIFDVLDEPEQSA